MVLLDFYKEAYLWSPMYFLLLVDARGEAETTDVRQYGLGLDFTIQPLPGRVYTSRG